MHTDPVCGNAGGGGCTVFLHRHRHYQRNNKVVVKVRAETYREHLDELQMTIYNLKARIERLKTQLPKWIPVTKRLPKDSKTKVVTLIDGSTEAGYYSDGEWWCIGDYMALDNRTVIAWMELPEAWKG